jgi:hypothetical protein
MSNRSQPPGFDHPKTFNEEYNFRRDKQEASRAWYLPVCLTLRHEKWVSTFLRNVDELLPVSTLLRPIRQCSYSPLWENQMQHVIVQLSLTSRYFLPLMSKNILLSPASRTNLIYFLPLIRETKFQFHSSFEQQIKLRYLTLRYSRL